MTANNDAGKRKTTRRGIVSSSTTKEGNKSLAIAGGSTKTPATARGDSRTLVTTKKGTPKRVRGVQLLPQGVTKSLATTKGAHSRRREHKKIAMLVREYIMKRESRYYQCFHQHHMMKRGLTSLVESKDDEDEEKGLLQNVLQKASCQYPMTIARGYYWMVDVKFNP